MNEFEVRNERKDEMYLQKIHFDKMLRDFKRTRRIR